MPFGHSKTAIIAASVSILAACSSGGGGGAPGFSPNGQKAASPNTRGVFHVEKKSALGPNAEIPADMKLVSRAECAGVTGMKTFDYYFDPATKVGATFDLIYEFANLQQSFAYQSALTIDALGSRESKSTQILTNIAATGLPGEVAIPAQLTMTEQCRQKVAGAHPFCKTKVVDWQMPPDFTNTFVCDTAPIYSGPYSGTVETGTFTLGSGRTVRAIRTTWTYPVEIKCSKDHGPREEYGTGHWSQTKIETNELASMAAISCRQNVTLFEHDTITQDSGTVLMAYKKEFTSAPVR